MLKHLILGYYYYDYYEYFSMRTIVPQDGSKLQLWK